MTEYAATDPLWSWRATDNELIDDRGRRLFDATSALWCNLFGHRVRAIDAAVREQLDRIAHSTLLGATHPPAAELARRLVEIAPSGLTHVFFSDDGATAVEAALKIAFQYRLLTKGAEAAERAVYLSLENAYHGDTLGAAAVGGVALFHETFRPILLPTLKAASPYCYRCPLGRERPTCELACRRRRVEAILARESGRVCAVLVEPGVQAAAGMLVLPDGFLSRVADACRRHGALLIARRGRHRLRPHRHALRLPDARASRPICCASPRDSPAATCPWPRRSATDEVYRTFLGRYDEYRHFFHGHTYTGNPLGCAAALATLASAGRRPRRRGRPAQGRGAAPRRSRRWPRTLTSATSARRA